MYHYDVEDQEAYGTRNNRLMWYAVSQNGQDIEKVYYAYHAGGHADQIIRKAAGDATYYRTYFLYDKQGRTWMAVKDQWQLDGQTGAPVNAQRTWAREFRYAGSGRQRYLTRARDPETLLPASAADGLWSDDDGEGVYGDYGVDVGTGTAEGSTLMQYEPGVWQRDAADPEMPLDYYFHGDIIGSTRAMSDGEGSAVQRVIYTAFGERVYAWGGAGVPPASRYGYAGAWGYEGGGVWGAENELPWLHVGERLYDPATGRFLQRDPIGVSGGLNTYVYVENCPTVRIDPSGLLMPPDGPDFMIMRDADRRDGISHEETCRRWANANGAAVLAHCGANIAVQSAGAAVAAGTTVTQWVRCQIVIWTIRIRPAPKPVGNPFPPGIQPPPRPPPIIRPPRWVPPYGWGNDGPPNIPRGWPPNRPLGPPSMN